MAAEEKWYFTREQLANTPSRKSGYDADKELSCRQQAANFIQDMGQRLQVNQLCINTAIVYMHRFYMFHSFTRFHRNAMAAAALFLAAKVEEQPRKLEHVIKVAQICLHREQPPPDVKSEVYIEQAQELVVNENILLQTLGFDVAIDHPHTHVVKCCHLVRASKDLAQTSYFMASNSLHLTTMCLQYKPTVVACFCIHLACKWSNWEIPQSNEGKPWFWYIDKTVSQELLEQLTDEFLVIFDKCPSRLKKKIMSISSNQNPTILSAFSNEGDKKRNGEGSSNQSGITFGGSGDDFKKKQEFLRHHPDYKKHHMAHHGRSDSHSMSKSSCMFGPPTRTIPQNHSIAGVVNSSSVLRSLSSSCSSSSNSKSAVDAGSLISGKPEHLHHRPRRPDDKQQQPLLHPPNSSSTSASSSSSSSSSSSNSSIRNHELITTQSSQYKKYDKVSSASVLSDFQTSSTNSNANNSSNSSNNRIAMSSSNSSSYLNTSQSHIQSTSNLYLQQQQQQLIVSSHIPSTQANNLMLQQPNQQNTEVLSRISSTDTISQNASGQALGSSVSNKHQPQLLTPKQLLIQSAVSSSQLTTQPSLPVPTITNQTKAKSPVVMVPHQQPATTKVVERSIFSPEKSTPPSESTKLGPSVTSSSFLTPAVVQQQQHNVVSQPSNPINQLQSSNVLRKKADSMLNDSSNLMAHTKLTDEPSSSSVVQNKLATTVSVLNQPHHPLVNETVIKPASEIKEGIICDTVTSSTETVQPLVNIPVSVSSVIAVNAASEEALLLTKEQKKKKKKHKEHKDKHKEKHKHKHKSRDPEPIVITIPKEKLTLPQQAHEQGILKIKIAKDKIATSISPASTGLKIKIPKEKIKESRKRDRSEDSAAGGGPGKFHRPNGTTLQVGMEQTGQH